MSRLFSLIRSAAGSAPSSRPESRSTSPGPSLADIVAQEMGHINEAMDAAELVMNDDIDGAEKRLSKGNSSYHLLALGVCTFMRSILGFEKEMMIQASARLSECETKAWLELKKAQKEAASRGGQKQRMYPPGTEYLLVICEAQLMGAVVSVLHESLTEAIKGFYKLRKAFVTLDSIMEMEAKAIREWEKRKSKQEENGETRDAIVASELLHDGNFSNDKGLKLSKQTLELSSRSSTEGKSGEADASQSVSRPGSRNSTGLQTPMDEAALAKKLEVLRMHSGVETPFQLPSMPQEIPEPKNHTSTGLGSDDDIFAHPLDSFVHSGANMCFGILLLLISMVPPAFSKLLYVIGFKGDRDRGLKMLWQSTKFQNINGAVAGLVLLTYYNGQLAFGDILRQPRDLEDGSHDVNGWPEARCIALLENMRQRYPRSGLWRLEEARGLSNARRLPEAIEVLKNNTNSKMRQVAALNNFELSLSAMFARDMPLMKEGFLRCVELNDWSHSLYYYIAACAEVEQYRDAIQDKDEALARQKKKSAEELLRKAPSVAGRKKFLARQMPFEVFVVHKVAKWEERSKRLGVDLIDAIGVSPAAEMSFLWNGSKKMTPPDLERAKGELGEDRITASIEKRMAVLGESDEQGVRALCLANLERERGKWNEARKLLLPTTEVDMNEFKGPNKDNYVLPCTYYELAVLAWTECCEAEESMSSSSTPSETEVSVPAPVPASAVSNASNQSLSTAEKALSVTFLESTAEATPANMSRNNMTVFEKTVPPGDKITARKNQNEADAYRRVKALECLELLEKVARWESFILDARMGLRVQTGLDNVRWLINKKGWVVT